ncbi:amidophosphoribosyltransferase [Prevotella sp. CAG:924]|nr:amidophosphoribosyltransferase [Prevotella sp. CAG:924]
MENTIHEDCGVAMVRLLKPLSYYQQKYGTWRYGLNKLYLMMEKQHNRGQEGAGIASVKLDTQPGREYMFRERAEGPNAITEIFAAAHKQMNDSPWCEKLSDDPTESTPAFAGELYMGHLRYSTTGKSGLKYVHPFLRRNNWRAKNLCLCGNYNMTNVEEVFQLLTRQGQCPRIYSDSYIMLELMGHRLDREVERNFVIAREQGLEDKDITRYIDTHVKMENVLKTTMIHFDGGYVVCGITGSGEMFAMRDPWGIRPAFFYLNDEVVAVASERPVLQTTFDSETEEVHELQPGTALIIRADGSSSIERIMDQKDDKACSFERIYFSRGSDRDIYLERKKLGEQLTQPVLKAVGYDTDHTVLSFIPNTAEVAFYGLLDGFNKWIAEEKAQQVEALGANPSHEELMKIMMRQARQEKVAWKDIKLRTFITEGNARNDLAAHVYDITYGSLQPNVDNLVIIDDSIVRGTTLKESILHILDRLHPRKIVVVSSAPQIRYPDYYGIDMPRLEEFCVFHATMALVLERNMGELVEKTYQACLDELKKPAAEQRNCVRDIYTPFTVEEINAKIVEMLRPEGMTIPIDIVFQSLEGLHTAIPNHKGDWYFTGHYPTPGGTRLCNQAFVNYVENVYRKVVKG